LSTVLEIQGESLLKPECETGIAEYQSLVATIARYVRAKNSKIAVYAHVTFRFTPPSPIVQWMTAMAEVVDGFLLSYPVYTEHIYCTAENLETVLKAFRSAAP
jgi:hypothetical protein